MRFASREDTIVAVSTAWQSAPAAIVRISGPLSVPAVRSVLMQPAAWPDHRPASIAARICVPGCGDWPARITCFAAPRSYTGQDVVEILTVGALPLVRRICEMLIAAGARRALPGEFTARAFLNGRMRHDEVDGVLHLLRAGDDVALRRAARQARGNLSSRWDAIRRETLDLLAAVEAGVDFADEEDVRFIAPRETTDRLEALRAAIPRESGASASLLRAGRRHVALVGLPNAGKSALFNTLIGAERAIVSPVLGTTRDVLACELTVGGHEIVLQDCAGLGASADELDLAAHQAAERTAAQADLVLWVHAVDAEWADVERVVLDRIDADRCVLVLSKSDIRGHVGPVPWPCDFKHTVAVSAVERSGLDQLNSLIATRLNDSTRGDDGAVGEIDAAAIDAALARASALLAGDGELLTSPELIAIELRIVLDALRRVAERPSDEAVLDRIFARFCVGK